ncbi:MAG: spore coat polysaccharide biosynthesis protein SpsF [Epulopiscium sp.]|nr:spore coat polysaccharide biosynthesis protein SpsF [Candidatus Epulonipiscium sp.]
MKKVVAMIQAHMASTRLPGKIMLPLGDKAVLYHVYKRCKMATVVDEVVVLTSTNPENDKIEEFCKDENIPCFRGEEEDVLDRYYQCAKVYQPDIIVRVTSDCPLIEPKLIDYWVTNMIRDDVEYFKEEDRLYKGFGLDIFTMEALEKLKQNATTKKQKEHVVGYYYDHPDEFYAKGYPLPKELEYAYSNHRLTLDTPKDYELIKLLYDLFYTKNDIVDLKKVMEYLDNHPEITAINQDVKQKDYFKQQ